MADSLPSRYRPAALTYARDLVERHVSGRLKVAPEHTSDRVLNLMRKPSFSLFHRLKKFFDEVNQEAGLKQQLIPYFISSHPGCTEEDMATLAVETKRLGFRLEQIQDFTPTPMTLATEIYYTGLHPYTLERVYTAVTENQKRAQHQFFFWYQPAERARFRCECSKDVQVRVLSRARKAKPSQPTSLEARHIDARVVELVDTLL